MIYFPHAKINIGLRVLGKRTDGFHDIESVFFPVPLHDILEIIPSEAFQFTYSGVDHIDGENLVTKAYQALQRITKVPLVKIHLHKAIPIGAGVGGGSSDASFTLRALNEQFQLYISDADLHEVALSLGSDCPFFLKNQPQYVTGRGEHMKEAELQLKGYQLIVVNPGIHISTKEAYSNLIIPKREGELSFNETIKLPMEEWGNHFQNDFEQYAFNQYPELEHIKKEMSNAGAIFSSMTGTGSTVYGFFKDKNQLPTFPSKYMQRVIQL